MSADNNGGWRTKFKNTYVGQEIGWAIKNLIIAPISELGASVMEEAELTKQGLLHGSSTDKRRGKVIYSALDGEQLQDFRQKEGK